MFVNVSMRTNGLGAGENSEARTSAEIGFANRFTLFYLLFYKRINSPCPTFRFGLVPSLFRRVVGAESQETATEGYCGLQRITMGYRRLQSSIKVDQQRALLSLLLTCCAAQ